MLDSYDNVAKDAVHSTEYLRNAPLAGKRCTGTFYFGILGNSCAGHVTVIG